MRRYDQFCKALDNLEIINQYMAPYDTVILTGLVGLFEICFEQAWKAMKEVLENEGIETAATGSPRAIIKEAYQIGLIYDEEGWLSALISRNNVTHSYNENIALDIVTLTKEKYLAIFEELKKSMNEFL